MKSWWGIPFGVLVGLLAAGAILLAASQPRGHPVTLVPPPPQAPLVVHVSGAVIAPGVYTLPVGSRVQDAVLAAGGYTQVADDQAHNLAARLSDGEWIRVPFHADYELQGAADDLANEPGMRLNINTATRYELEALPGITPVLAERILKYREWYGEFETLDDLLVIYGMTRETFDLIKDLLSVDSSP